MTTNKNKHKALAALGRPLRGRPCYWRYEEKRIMKIIFILIPLAITGCAFSAANHKLLSENQYQVNADGNIWDTEDTLLKTINKRAKKLCGEGNYEVIGDSEIVVGSVDTGVTVAPTQTLTRTVNCL